MQKKRRSSGKKEVPVYCVCRSSDGERFMIACDRCEEWYHGDCINVTPKQAEQIETFYCHQCRRKDATLQIKYKSTRTQRVKCSRQPPSPTVVAAEQPNLKPKNKRSRHSVEGSLKHKDDSSGSPFVKTERKLPGDTKVSPVSIIEGFGDCSSPNSTSISTAAGNTWSRYDDDPLPSVSQLNPPKSRAASPRARACGSCRGCIRSEDCGQCDYCLDRRKFGGPNRMRQKCRLRQCVGTGGRTRQPSQNAASRRRKQQTLQSVLLGTPSPRMHQYTDIEDEPFEVPMDFSPRSYPDPVQGLYSPYSSSQTAGGSNKLRRGDQRYALSHELTDLSSRTYQRLQLDATGDSMALLDDESDDDLVISGLQHCAGPTCMSIPLPGGRYCSDTCRIKHANSRSGFRGTSNRVGLYVDDEVIPYNLPYPDHLYCRHHRVNNLHSNGTMTTGASYRNPTQPFDSPFNIDEAAISDTLRHSHGQSPYPYSSGSAHHISQRHGGHTSNGRISGLPDSSETAAFLDSVESAMRRAVNSSVDELDMELRCGPHGRNNPHLSPSPRLVGANPYYTRGASDNRGGIHQVVDSDYALTPEVDGVDDGAGVSQHGSDYYCMMNYHSPSNGHSSRRSLDAVDIPDRRIDSISMRSRNMNHRLVLPDGVSSPNGIGSSYQTSRGVGLPSSIRHSGLSVVPPSLNSESGVGAGVSTGSVPVASMANQSSISYVPGPDEFYTINDSDDLEINWPQETGVSA